MKKDFRYYMSLNYAFTVEANAENGKYGFSLDIPDLPGCSADGRTVDEAIKKLNKAKEQWISASIEKGLPIPEPSSISDFGSKLLLKIDSALHMKLVKKAREKNESLNQYVKTRLEEDVRLSAIVTEIRNFQEQICKQMADIQHKLAALELNIISKKFSKQMKDIEQIADTLNSQSE